MKSVEYGFIRSRYVELVQSDGHTLPYVEVGLSLDLAKDIFDEFYDKCDEYDFKIVFGDENIYIYKSIKNRENIL